MYGTSGLTEFSNPAWLPGAFAYDDPAADFRRFASSEQFGGPAFFQRRAALNDYNRRMQARYLLDAPGMAQSANPSFYDYLVSSTAGGYVPPMADYSAIRDRAREAAIAATTTPGPYLAGGTGTQEDFNRRAWLSSQFAGENAAANQIAVANLLALQRDRGTPNVSPTANQRAYTGQMAQAISNAISTLYQQRLNQGAPKESFLSWYLDKRA